MKNKRELYAIYDSVTKAIITILRDKKEAEEYVKKSVKPAYIVVIKG